MGTHSDEQSRLKVPGPLVSVEWLAADLYHPDLVVLDASWYLPTSERDGEAEWLQRRIPGARFFDFDGRIRDTDSPLPHMLPSADWFGHEARRLGINRHSAVVVYDGAGLFASARGWWMLRAMGCANVAVLNGGLPAWLLAEMPLEEGEPAQWAQGDFEAVLEEDKLSDLETVRASLDDSAVTVLDARPTERFHGRAPEPRADLRGGHMPGAVSLPHSTILEQGHLCAPDTLRSLLGAAVPEGNKLIFSCGSGVSASVLALGAEVVGYRNWSVYDGSWSEWGGRDDVPVVT